MPRRAVNFVTNYVKPLALKTKANAISFFSIMIPIIIIVKILQEFNSLNYLVYPFIPIMKLLDIPSVYALAWLVGILNNNYTTVSLVITFFKQYPLSYEQLSLLGLLCLLAHSLFIEVMLTYKLKIRIGWAIGVRLFSALVLAYIIHIVCHSFNLLQEVVNNPILSTRVIDTPPPTLLDLIHKHNLGAYFFIWLKSIGVWAWQSIKMMFSILCIMFSVLLIVEILKDIKIIYYIEKIAKPIFRLLHISKSNTSVTLVCFFIGLSYGWGILKTEHENNIFFRNDQSFKVITFLLLIHSVIEDSLLFIVIGCSIIITVLARFLWALLLIYILGKFVLPKLSRSTKRKYLYY